MHEMSLHVKRPKEAFEGEKGPMRRRRMRNGYQNMVKLKVAGCGVDKRLGVRTDKKHRHMGSGGDRLRNRTGKPPI